MLRPPIDSGTVLITGACHGIGREVARQLARRAGTLVLVSNSTERLESLRAELQARNATLGVVLMTCDISRPGEVGDMLAELARQFIAVDVLVNAAGMGERGRFAEQRWGSIERMLAVNVISPLLLMRRLLGPMLTRGRGGILHIGAGASQLFLPGAATYAATRRCLDGFLESLRLELEDTGIVLTQASPGPVDENEPLAEGERPEPRPLFQLSAARCAREALAAFEHGVPLVYPGRFHRWMMTWLPRLPRSARRALGRRIARELPARSGMELALPAEAAREPVEDTPTLA